MSRDYDAGFKLPTATQLDKLSNDDLAELDALVAAQVEKRFRALDTFRKSLERRTTIRPPSKPVTDVYKPVPREGDRFVITDAKHPLYGLEGTLGACTDCLVEQFDAVMANRTHALVFTSQIRVIISDWRYACTGCSCPVSRCGPPLWDNHKKCCPECSHTHAEYQNTLILAAEPDTAPAASF
jgi:hypothetical protein